MTIADLLQPEHRLLLDRRLGNFLPPPHDDALRAELRALAADPDRDPGTVHELEGHILQLRLWLGC